MNVLDPAKNFALVEVSGMYDASATAISLATDEGAKLPDPSSDGEFNLIWWNQSDYPNPSDDPNHEIVRVTARSGDDLTVVRPASGNNYHGEGSDNTASTKNSASKTYKMALGYTKYIHDLIDALSVGFSQAAPTETPNGSITNFSTAEAFSPGTLIVFKNGVKMKEGASNDYQEDADNSGYTFNTAPLTGDIITHVYFKANGQMLQGSNSLVTRETPSGTINGTNTTFTLAGTPISGSEEVYLNGQLQTQGASNDYTISGGTITFVTAPSTGDILRVSYLTQGTATHNADTVDGYNASEANTEGNIPARNSSKLINANGLTSDDHVVLTPATSKLVKIAVIRQDDTTNSYKNNTVVLTGWGYIAGAAGDRINETVTFGLTFSELPIVIANSIGKTSATIYDIGDIDGVANTTNVTHPRAITTTSFNLNIEASNSNALNDGAKYGYSWIAIGQLT